MGAARSVSAGTGTSFSASTSGESYAAYRTDFIDAGTGSVMMGIIARVDAAGAGPLLFLPCVETRGYHRRQTRGVGNEAGSMKLTDEWDRLGPVEIDGIPHDIWILDMRVDPRSRGALIEVKVAAKSPSGRHYIGRFHVAAERLNDEGVARAIATMEMVIRGSLPPTARETPW